MTSEDERRAEALVRHLADAASSGAGCLDADLVAGFAEGRLPAAERAAVVAHAADCADCRGWIASVATAVASAAPSLAPIRRLPWPAAAAAAVLFAVVAGYAWRRSSQRDGPPTDERLVAAVAELRAAAPTAFADFTPLTPEERRAPGEAVERGGVAVLRPRGALLDGRPSFVWEAVPGAARYRVRVRGEDGRVLLERTTTAPALDYPADAAPIAPGTAFVWRVAAGDPPGETTGSAAARVLSEAERARFAGGLTAIRSKAPERLRAVLSAQWALRTGLLEEARKFLDAAPPEGGWTDVETQTRDLVRRRLGLPSEQAPR